MVLLMHEESTAQGGMGLAEVPASRRVRVRIRTQGFGFKDHDLP